MEQGNIQVIKFAVITFIQPQQLHRLSFRNKDMKQYLGDLLSFHSLTNWHLSLLDISLFALWLIFIDSYNYSASVPVICLFLRIFFILSHQCSSLSSIFTSSLLAFSFKFSLFCLFKYHNLQYLFNLIHLQSLCTRRLNSTRMQRFISQTSIKMYNFILPRFKNRPFGKNFNHLVQSDHVSSREKPVMSHMLSFSMKEDQMQHLLFHSSFSFIQIKWHYRMGQKFKSLVWFGR